MIAPRYPSVPYLSLHELHRECAGIAVYQCFDFFFHLAKIDTVNIISEINMKRTNIFSEKDKFSESKPQAEISSYFSNQCNNEISAGNDNNATFTTNCVSLKTMNDNPNKRKTCERLEPLQFKVFKYNNDHDIRNLKKIDNKGVTLAEPAMKTGDNYKENIENSICESTKKVVNANDNEKSHAKECFEDMSDYFLEDFSLNTEISFNAFERCKVLDVKMEKNNLLLTVKSEEREMDSATVICSGYWAESIVNKGDIVAINAVRENFDWIIDNMRGHIIIHPDILISGTTVSAGTFCKRKAVLAERFRKIESLPCEMGDQTALVIGNLAHQLIQKAIFEKVRKLSDVEKLMDQILSTKVTTAMLYESKMTINSCRKQLFPYLEKIYEFIQHYRNGNKQEGISKIQANFKGNIIEVRDIEENIWLPKLGVKGRVDITVGVKINSRRKVVPLEIKTGKPTFSAAHRGQIALYIMMLTLTGQDTNTGLLLYLRDNLIQEITSAHVEERDLILIRNAVANSLKSILTEKVPDITSRSDLPLMELPEPISHHSACGKCSYNALCCAFLTKDKKTVLPQKHPLLDISKQILENVKPAHIDYILQWISLLEMEEIAQNSNNPIKNLWTLSPKKREEKGTCISCLKVVGSVTEEDERYRHTFTRIGNKDTSTNILCTEFSQNEYVLVSTDTRINISAGLIVDIEMNSVTLLLDRDITQNYINEHFHIDKYSSSSLFCLNLANIGGLLSDNDHCKKLRDIVIDRKPATFKPCVPPSMVEKSAEFIGNLNKNQQRAVLKALIMDDYILIKGMPGTGKTETLVSLISLLNKTKQSILITAHTNSAVDNILLKLLHRGIDFLRLGSSIHPSLILKSEEHATSHCNSPEELNTVYSNKNIIGVTCFGAYHPLLAKRMFDVCIVDESTQALQPTVLRPLYSARKFVLVGDPDQLPSVIKSKQARKLGADESLFVRLDNENNAIILTQQYRMNKNIMYLANKFAYEDKMEIGDPSIANATLSTPSSREVLRMEAKWIQKALSQDIDDSVIMLDTGCTCELKFSSKDVNSEYSESDQMSSNIWESLIVKKLTTVLLKMGIERKNIGIVAPYRAHVNLLRKVVDDDIEVNTVDQYQGRDKEVILYSCAKSLPKDANVKELEVLGDQRRLTVATTRAKKKLILIADKETVVQYSTFKKLFALIKNENVIDLTDSDAEFSWSALHLTN